MVVLLCLIAGQLMAQEPEVTPLMSKDLMDFPGKEVLVMTVEYAPGGSDPIHRHNAHGFLYVLEGSVVMQVKGGKEITLTPGQTFYEGPNDVHVVGRNASSTKPAKFLVFLVKNKGAPPLVVSEVTGVSLSGLLPLSPTEHWKHARQTNFYCSTNRNSTIEEDNNVYNHDQRRHRNLLQGMGQGPSGNVLTRMALEF
jgi:quercetin dioxygenase-like cupin family protein